MSKKNREDEALEFIYASWETTGKYPTNADVGRKLNINANNWGGIRRRMIEKGKLTEAITGDFALAETVIEEFKHNEQLLRLLHSSRSATEEKRPTIGKESIESQLATSTNIKAKIQNKGQSQGRNNYVEIPIYGEVRAGKGGPDDLVVDLSPINESLLLPDPYFDQETETYVLQVVGDSMISDNILAGDYIIVEKIPLTQVNEGDLIVARPLKEKYNFDNVRDQNEFLKLEEDFYEASQIEKNYLGYTLKYYHKEEKIIKGKDGRVIKNQTIYRLSPKNRDPEYTIHTLALDENEVGRVVAVHRIIRRLLGGLSQKPGTHNKTQ